MTYGKNSNDLLNDYTVAMGMARDAFAKGAGATLALEAGVAEDILWTVRSDGERLTGQVGAGYYPDMVRDVIGSFAKLLGGSVTGWGSDNLKGIETAGMYGGVKVIVWGVLHDAS